MGRVISTDNSSTATMNSLDSSVQVMKSKSVKATMGVYTFNDAIVIGPPGKPALLKITSDAISTTTIAEAYPSLGPY
jgi:anthranilate/para-aminobenzoate synthase component II